MKSGCKNDGHTSVHLPHLKQFWISGVRDSSSSKHKIPEEPLLVAISVVYWAIPIIGPPIITLPIFLSSLNPPHCSIISETNVPTFVIRFFGSLMQLPVIVVILSTKGIPVLIDLAICAAVATLSTTAPAAIGNPPDGTSLPVHA